jgi:hypothetical protein
MNTKRETPALFLTIQDALSRAESFMNGFTDDENQESIEQDLEVIRTALSLVASVIDTIAKSNAFTTT